MDFECPECGNIFHVDELPSGMKPIMCPDCGYNGCKYVRLEVDELRAEVLRLRAELAQLKGEKANEAINQMSNEARSLAREMYK